MMKSLELFMQKRYQEFYDLFIPLFVAPTIEESIIASDYKSVEEFWNSSYTFTFEGPYGKEETREYYYRNLIESLDDFGSAEELARFLDNEYRTIKHQLLLGKLQWEMRSDY